MQSMVAVMYATPDQCGRREIYSCDREKCAIVDLSAAIEDNGKDLTGSDDVRAQVTAFGVSLLVLSDYGRTLIHEFAEHYKLTRRVVSSVRGTPRSVTMFWENQVEQQQSRRLNSCDKPARITNIPATPQCASWADVWTLDGTKHHRRMTQVLPAVCWLVALVAAVSSCPQLVGAIDEAGASSRPGADLAEALSAVLRPLRRYTTAMQSHKLKQDLQHVLDVATRLRDGAPLVGQQDPRDVLGLLEPVLGEDALTSGIEETQLCCKRCKHGEPPQTNKSPYLVVDGPTVQTEQITIQDVQLTRACSKCDKSDWALHMRRKFAPAQEYALLQNVCTNSTTYPPQQLGKFKLVALVLHMGAANAGHYACVGMASCSNAMVLMDSQGPTRVGLDVGAIAPPRSTWTLGMYSLHSTK